MGTNPNPAITNRKNTQVFVENRTEPHRAKNRTEPEPKCYGSYSVLSLNETVGTFTRFTVNEAFYFT